MIKYNSYKFRIYPTPDQEEQLFKTIGCARKVYNELLKQRNALYAQRKSELLNEEDYRLAVKKVQYSSLKNELPYLKEVDSLALANAKRNLDTAYKRFYKGESNLPTFKKKDKSNWSYTTNVVNGNLFLSKNGLKLPKLKGLVKIVNHRNTKGTLKSVTVSKNRDNTWYVSLRYAQKVEVPIYPSTLGEIINPVGGDLGLKELLILSTGELIENLRLSYKYKEKLAKEQRILSRRREQAKKSNRKLSESANYQKQRIKVAKIHSKIKRCREDYLHKVSHFVVKHHDFISLETLSSKNLSKNHKLAFAIQDVSWDKFTTFLEYKMIDKNGFIVYIDRFYPSTQLCSSCGEKDGPRGLSNLNVRSWVCSSCGSEHDRDINAAKNILDEGLRVLADYFDRWDNGGFDKPSLVISSTNKKEVLASCSQEKDNNIVTSS